MAKGSWLRSQHKTQTDLITSEFLYTRNNRYENTNGVLLMWYNPQLHVGVKQIVLIISSWILHKAFLQSQVWYIDCPSSFMYRSSGVKIALLARNI